VNIFRNNPLDFIYRLLYIFIMDSSTPIITDEIKKVIFDKLADSYIEEVGSGRLSPGQRQSICKWILEAVRGAQKEDDLLVFFDYLSRSYPFFKAATMNLKSEMALNKEKELMGKLKQYYQKLSI